MKKFYIVNIIMALSLSLLITGMIGALALYSLMTKDLPSITKITDYQPNLVTTVYASDGQILGYLYREQRFLKKLNEIPIHLTKAFLAAEDSSFYEHEGLDISAIARAFVINVKSGGIVQGGSTITQQIVKQLLLSSRKKYERKFKEAILSYQLENYLTKDEILTVYLNQVFLGAGAYGVEAGARTYFGKHVEDLTLAEACVLAGLPKAPSTSNPFHFPHEARIRQTYVLDRLRELNWISDATYMEARNQKLVYKTMPEPTWKLGAYYLEEVRRWLIDYLSKENMKRQGIELDRYGEDAVYLSGLHVYTAIDLEHQAAAERALKLGLEASTRRRGWRGPDENINPAEFKDFLKENPVNLKDLKIGDMVKTLVLDVNKEKAIVLAGGQLGEISAASMKWTYRGAPKNIVKPGDVVWASLTEPARPKKEDKDKPFVLKLALKQWPKVQGALVSLEPPTGNVVAIAGGYDFNDSQFNRATQARRQPGSSFKPFVYSAALDAGFKPTSVVMDSPISFGNWSPKNYGSKYSGPMTLTNALVRSKNVVTVRIAARIGIKRVIARARALGLEANFPPFLPICLGAEALSPINMAQAYSAFARDGSYVKPRLVLGIKKAWGEEIFRSVPTAVKAISPENAWAMVTILKQVVQRGTGVRARVLKRPVAGKTGTTNEEKDAWFMGFSPYLLTGVYVGFDQIKPMGRSEAGSRAALPIWLDYRMKVEDKYPIQDFTPPHEVQLKLAQNKNGYADYGDYSTPFGEPQGPPQSAASRMDSQALPTRKKINRSAATNDELLKQLY